MSPSISVVIPTLNSERYLAETLESVINQTLQPSEIILVDGGSTDSTLAIGVKFGARIAATRSHNISSGRNIGMREALNDLVAFLDHDDLWSATKLERQVAALEEFPESAMVITDYTVFSELSGTSAASDASEVYRRAIRDQGGMFFPAIDFNNREWIVPLTSSAVVRNRVEWFDESLQGTDDIEFFLRMMTHPFVLLDEPLTQWRRNPNSYSQKKPYLMDLDFITTMEKVMESPRRYPPGIAECVRGLRKSKLRQTAVKLLKQRQFRPLLGILYKTFSWPC